MVSRDIFEVSRQKFGRHGSWAVWGAFGNRPKDNMGDLSIFEGVRLDETLKTIHVNYVLVGLNVSKIIDKDLGNFHGTNGEVYKVRFALHGTPLWGGYMTDVLKDFPHPDSREVERAIRENPALVDGNLAKFDDELRCLGAEAAVLVALGRPVYEVLARKFSPSKLSRYRTTDGERPKRSIGSGFGAS